jgi:hypothetical protein
MIANRLVGKLHSIELKSDFTRNSGIKKAIHVFGNINQCYSFLHYSIDQFITLLNKKIYMKLLITALVLFFALPVVSQIEATTKEGKKVLLYKNGTWKYAKAKTTTTMQVPPAAVAIPMTAVTASPEDLKNEAREFSIQLINTYFTQDCDTYYSYLSPEILLLESNVALTLTDEVRSKVCESVQRAVSDKSKTLQDYLNTYNLELLTRAELEAKVGRSLPEHFNTTDMEFYVVGFEPKVGSSTKFIWDDMFAFLIRKTNGTWKMKAPLGG